MVIAIENGNGNGSGRPGILSTKNPFVFVKSLFTESKVGGLDVPQEKLEDLLKNTYSGPLHDVPLPHVAGIPRPASLAVAFDMSNLKVKEVREFVRKARAKS